MGRGADDNVGEIRRKRPESLSVGRDAEGKRVRLGEKDSAGYTINFIAEDGSAWQDVAEHDEVRTVSTFEQAMLDWQEGRRPGGLPIAEHIAQEICLDSANISPASRSAQQNWFAIEARQRRELATRDENFRLFLRELPEERHPLFVDKRLKSYPSRIKGADIYLERITDTAEELEAIRTRIEDLNQRLEAMGLPVPPPEIVEGIIKGDTNIIEQINGEEPSVRNEEFDAIVAGLAGETPHIWQSELSISFGDHGDSLGVRLDSVGSKEAYENAVRLEEMIIEGPLTEENVAFHVAGRSLSPETEKSHALDILAQGEEHPFVIQGRAFGINVDELMKQAEEVALGERGDKAFVFMTAAISHKDFGRLEIGVSGETEEDALRRAKMILPGAYLEDSDSEESVY